MLRGALILVVATLVACAEPVNLARTRPPADAGLMLDAAPPPPEDGGEAARDDAGEPPRPCLRDQGGAALRGCPQGEICHLLTGTCRKGRACEINTDCDVCSALTDPADCGHGYPLAAWCDRAHGSVCVRSRSPCEPCQNDCGRLDPSLGGDPLACVTYSDGQRFCSRPCSRGCPDSFECIDDQCVRPSGCDRNSVICPSSAGPNPSCPGTRQICAGDPCGQGTNAVCATNDLPGALGICIGTCASSDECPADRPICNPRNGICSFACEMGACGPDQTCHSDGLCWPACERDFECMSRNEMTYCNLPGRDGDVVFKPYRDLYACVPRGCERPEDCPAPGEACDLSQDPPTCVEGCLDDLDCGMDSICRTPPDGPYDPADCASFPEHGDLDRLGICC